VTTTAARLATIAALLLASAPAQAGVGLELSIGTGVRHGVGALERSPSSVEATVGLPVTSALRLALGAVADLADVKASANDRSAGRPEFSLRPMAVLAPSLSPLYLRAIAGVTSLREGPRRFTCGGAVGVSASLIGLGAFAEAGALQRHYATALVGGGTSVRTGVQLEARVGVSVG
jgi:hypothetical protein